jgi:hypothetical protein
MIRRFISLITVFFILAGMIPAFASAASGNADLSGLTLSNGTLSPAFASSTTSYSAGVRNGVSTITVTPTVSDSGAAVTVNGTPVTSGTPSGAISLGVGSNTVTVVVTAQDGTPKVYTVTVTRAVRSSDAKLSALTLSSGTLTPLYTASVANAVSSITVTPTASDSGAKVTVNGTAVRSGTSSGAISLNVGINYINVSVIAEDSFSMKLYNVMVTRAASGSSDADLSGLTLSSGTLSPAFASGTASYTASVANDVSTITVTPTVSDSGATVTVNGTPVTSGTPSGAISLNVVSNTVTVVAMAQDGMTTKTYTVAVTRAAAPLSQNADLSALSLSNGTLTPAFVLGTTSYTASVANGVSSITVTPTLSDSNATVTVNDTVVADGTASGGNSLNVGSNTVTVVAMAEDGTTTKTYTVTVTRAASPLSNNADLSALSLSNGMLTPAFVSGTPSYTASVANGVSTITVMPTVSDSSATVTVNGTAVGSGTSSEAISLNEGNNTITVVATAQYGTSTKTYTVTVTRAAQTQPSPSSPDPTPPNDSKVISENGELSLPVGKPGEVSLGDTIKIDIPANATNKEMKLTIEKLLDTQEFLTDKDILASPVYEILKNFSENFSKPITLNFTFDPTSIKDNQRAAVFYYDEAKKEWVEVGGIARGNQISAEVDHFTKYAVLAVDSPSNVEVNLSDISRHWAEANIIQAVTGGIVGGYPDGTYKPDHTVTRAEFAVMLMNALKTQVEAEALTFIDLAKIPTWAQKAVAQAAQAGIIKGYENGTFRPDAEITRAEMAAMIANALKLKVEENAATGFADDKSIPIWAKGAAAEMKELGIMVGAGANTFNSDAKSTRAEAITVLLRMLAHYTSM